MKYRWREHFARLGVYFSEIENAEGYRSDKNVILLSLLIKYVEDMAFSSDEMPVLSWMADTFRNEVDIVMFIDEMAIAIYKHYKR